MRTPRWLREFSEWRWAACVLLLAGSLAFVVLALLLIPTQLNGAAPAVDAPQPLAKRAQPRPSLFAAAPAAPARPVGPPPSDDNAALLQPVAPAPAVTAPPANPPDFAANNADRGDRPGARIPRSTRDE